MRSLYFGMFTPRGLVNRRAVTFQGFRSPPPTLPDPAAEGMCHVCEKVCVCVCVWVGGGWLALPLLEFVKPYHYINCDQ